MIYQYRCNVCRVVTDTTRHSGDSAGACTATPNCTGEQRRKFSINIKPAMQEHFNATTNTVVSSMAGFKNDLKRAGDEYSEYTGQTVNFQPREWGEMGGTSEGLDVTNKERVDAGLPPLRVPGA